MKTGSVILLASLLTWPALQSGPRLPSSGWTRFRGPNGTGVSNDRYVPIRWSEHDIVWKTPLSGVGNSSPVIWGNRLFIQSASMDGRNRFLMCLDWATGRILWSYSVSGSSAKTHARNTLASSTPAADSNRVYALFWDGASLSLHACDHSGNLVWKADLGMFESQHGAGTSPIVSGDRVIVANDQDGSSSVVAMESSTGRVVWQQSRPYFDACYSTPILLGETSARPEVLVASTAGITGYDPVTGQRRWHWPWRFPGKPLRTVASPVAGRGMVFVSSGDGGGARHMVAVRLPEGGISDPVLAWESRRSFPYVPTMLIRGKHLYWVNDIGVAGCQVAETGENVWTERLGGNMTASPILIDGKIYAASEDGYVYVYPAEPRFDLLARNQVGEAMTATPAVSGNRLFIRGSHHLFCIGTGAGN